MNTHGKKYIQDLIKKIQDRHCKILDAINKNDKKMLVDLLTYCQNDAIMIGTFIEKKEIETDVIKKIISQLEYYCECVYNTSIREVNGEDTYTVLQDIIENINEDIKYKIVPKKEIVFMPYHANMWDSLESVFVQFKKDNNFNTYVVPIPYYDKNSDLSFGQFHYDGDRFPENIQIIHYEDYDIENSKPDVVFIHNPYDEYNNVTSVDPKYYSYEIKKYTDNLVYIPYFISFRDNIKEVFCTTSAVFSADMIILQSKEIKEKYVIEYKKQVKNQLEITKQTKDKTFWKNLDIYMDTKFLALGSPKIDKIVENFTKEKDIPKNWSDIIAEKKVIFYNTHITGLMVDTDNFIQKLRLVFDFFKGNNELALLWRPHPLSISTLKSRNSPYYETYINLVEYYKENNIGIYDDTADLHRSMAISDAYYGDGGSLLAMYSITGRPILLQDFNRVFSDRTPSIDFRAFCIENDSLYFTAERFNALLKYDLNTEKMEYIASATFEKNDNVSMYIDMFYVDDKIICIPLRADHIAVYNIKNNKFSNIKIDSRYLDGEYKFINCVEYNNNLFLIPFKYKAIVKISLDTLTLEYMSECIYELEKRASKTSDPYFNESLYVRGNMIFIPSCRSNDILELDMDKFTSQIRHIKCNNEGFETIIFDDKYCWLTPRYTWSTKTKLQIIKLDYETWEQETYPAYKDGIVDIDNKPIFIHSFITGDYINLTALEMKNYSIQIDKKTGQIQRSELLNSIKNKEKLATSIRYVKVKDIKQGIGMVNMYDATVTIIKNEQVSLFEIKSDLDILKNKKMIDDSKGFYAEDEYININNYSKIIDSHENKNTAIHSNAGEKIYKHISKIIKNR